MLSDILYPSFPASFMLLFMARQMQNNFRVKGKKLYFGSVDLEKAFDSVPREVISWEYRNCHGGHIYRIQGCPAMGTAVFR